MERQDPQKIPDAAILAAIVDSSDDVIVGKTLDGIITSWNRSAERTFGYTADEAIGQHISLIIPLELHAEEADVLARIRRGEKVDHFETVRQTKDGRRLNISLTVSPIKDAEGRIIGASKVARDITKQKQADKEREEMSIRERSAYARAQEADRLKDEFLAVLSHELRTPLTAIVGWTTLLVNGKLDEAKARRAHETILRNAQIQDQLINDLLDVSRIISGKLGLNLTTVDPESVLKAALDVVRPAADAKGVRLEVFIDTWAGPLTGDASRLQQIIWNLLSNGIKFTPKGGRVEARLQRINSNIELIVRDTGIGINPQAIPYIFERFRQGDASVTRQYGGLGLGLAIVRHLVELHGGTVTVDSAGEGQGSTFTVRLPIMFVARRMETEEQVHPVATTSPRLQGLRVLVVDDEADTREIVSLILSQAEAEVRAASDAAAAMEMLEQWRPDVLVSDIGMPAEDGYAFIRRVRERSRDAGGQIPAVALTAYARVEDRLRVLSSGYQMHVPKPVQALELVTVVASIANRL